MCVGEIWAVCGLIKFKWFNYSHSHVTIVEKLFKSCKFGIKSNF